MAPLVATAMDRSTASTLEMAAGSGPRMRCAYDSAVRRLLARRHCRRSLDTSRIWPMSTLLWLSRAKTKNHMSAMPMQCTSIVFPAW
eukprot:1037937-Pyramimonas_sp.AAC.1